MTIQELIVLALKVSVLTIVFSLGLKASLRDVAYLFDRPWLLVRSILAMNVLMVVFAVIVSLLFPIPLPVKIALVALSLSPVPPILPNKQSKAGGNTAYSVSLLVIASLVSLLVIPLALSVVGVIFGAHYGVSLGKLISIILLSIIAPLFLGIAVRKLFPALAEKMARPLGLFATILLILSALPIFYTTGAVLWQLVGNGVVVFLLLFSLLGLAVGHVLGGPRDDQRVVLALATATRHPAIALAIATINFPEETTILAVLLWHLLFSAIISAPYMRWRKGAHQFVEGAGR